MDPTLLAAQLRCPSGDAGRQVGERLAQFNTGTNDWALQLLDIQDNDAVLELGFGPGVALESAAKKTTGLVAGIELSEVMLKMAEERNADPIAKRKMELHQGDSLEIPYDDETFDKVFAVNTVYFWVEPKKQMEEILRVLKDDGFLVLVFLEPESWMPGLKESGLFRAYSAEDAEKLAEEAGFTGISIQRKQLPDAKALALVALK